MLAIVQTRIRKKFLWGSETRHNDPQQRCRVISTGPYAFVRHPMYVGGLLLFIGTPLALGSYWGLLAFVVVLPALIWRLLDEEKFLAKNLPGYVEYCSKVRWRLIPGVF